MKNKQYKILLILIKYTPWFLGSLYFIGTILSYFNIYPLIFSWLFFTSFWPLVILYSTSVVFQFCIWHRLPLYYILLCNILNLINWYCFSVLVFTCHIIVFGFLILLGAYLKNKHNEQIKIIKNRSS